MNTVARLARRTREILGRPVRCSGVTDWGAVGALKAAAEELGLSELNAWVPSNPCGLRALVAAYASRYAEAYGLGSLRGADETAAKAGVIHILSSSSGTLKMLDILSMDSAREALGKE